MSVFPDFLFVYHGHAWCPQRSEEGGVGSSGTGDADACEPSHGDENQTQVLCESNKCSQQWWSTPLTPAFGRQRQADLREFGASLVFRVSSRTARAIQGLRKTNKNLQKRREGRKKEKKRKAKLAVVVHTHSYTAEAGYPSEFIGYVYICLSVHMSAGAHGVE